MAKRYTQTFDTYCRGMLQRRVPRARDAGYVNEALNLIARGGRLESRPGLRPFNGVAFAGTLRGIGWHVAPDGSRVLLAATDAGFQRCVLGGDPVSLPLTNVPVLSRPRVAVDKVWFLSLSGGTNTTFIYDGVNENLKWDGIALTRMGLPSGTTPVVPTTSAGVVTKGTRHYVITLVSPYHEGDISVVDRVVVSSVDNQQFTFASPVQTPGAINTGRQGDSTADAVANKFDDPQVVKWRLWRTIAGGAELRFIGEADIGVAITDNVPDSTLRGNDLVEQLVNGPPQAAIAAMVEHRGQLIAVMADDLSLLRFSNFDPEYEVPEGWPRNYVQPVAHGDGDTITALRSFSEWCIIFKNNSTHGIVGESFAEYKIVPILAGGTRMGIGTGFPGSVLQVENSVFFAARDGFYRVNRFETSRALIYGGVVATRVSEAIDDLYAAADFSFGSATFFDRKRRAFVFLGHG